MTKSEQRLQAILEGYHAQLKVICSIYLPGVDTEGMTSREMMKKLEELCDQHWAEAYSKSPRRLKI